jgi:hypothetical protein
VLRPEEGEDGQLEVVRVAVEKPADPVEFGVGQTERAVEGLFRDLAQMIIVSGKPDDPRGVGNWG